MSLNYKSVKGKILGLFSDKYFFAVFLIFLIGTLLRFWHLPEFVTYLGDQGRDAIVIKRILTLEHFPAIGAPTSVGQVYLGPFYYFFIAPWLLLFNFDPVGPAVGVAFFSSLYILINYFVVKDIFNRDAALISTVFVGFSTILIESSRYSWNPNLLPVFSLLTVYFFIKSIKTKKQFHFLAAGAFLSFCLQLHYLALFLAVPIIFYIFMAFFEDRKDAKKILYGSLLSFFSFLFFSLPLLIFDLRHQFLNTKNFILFFKSSEGVAQGKISNVFSTFNSLNKFSFNLDLAPMITGVFLLLIFVSFLLTFKKRENIKTLILLFIFLIFGLSLYSGPKYPHYFGSIYPIYFVLIAYFLSVLISNSYTRILIPVFLIAFILLNSKGYFFLKGEGANQIQMAKNIASVIKDNVSAEKFTLTSLPQRYSDSTYRYFLEIWGKKPIEKDSLEKGEELFAVCEAECKVIGDPGWDVAYFAPTRVVEKWNVGDVTIYKLIR